MKIAKAKEKKRKAEERLWVFFLVFAAFLIGLGAMKSWYLAAIPILVGLCYVSIIS